jgi:hypothetical protein
MNDQVTQPRPAPAVKPTIPAMQVYIEGKILRHRRHELKFFTCIAAAAADIYSHPSTVEVRSDNQLGEVDQVVKVVCKLSSSVRQFQFTEKQTGMRKTGNDMSCYFDVIAG